MAIFLELFLCNQTHYSNYDNFYCLSFYSFFTSERVFNVESLLIVESTEIIDLDISSMLSGSGGISDSIDNQVIYKLRSISLN